MPGLNFGEITKQPKHQLKDETDYTPKHQNTLLYKLGLIYKTLDQTWGTNTSAKVCDKLEKNPTAWAQIDKLKNVTCNFFTQQADLNDPAGELMHLCKITFSCMAVVQSEWDEKKFIAQYKSWPKAISNMMKSDASDYNEFKAKVDFKDVTNKLLGKDIVVQREWTGTCAPSTSTVNVTNIPQKCDKIFYRFTKLYQITVSE